jgi:hypothetical protein
MTADISAANSWALRVLISYAEEAWSMDSVIGLRLVPGIQSGADYLNTHTVRYLMMREDSLELRPRAT